jgi:hypothetical protein
MTLKTLKDIVIPAGTELSGGCAKRVFHTPHFIADIAHGNDHTSSFTVDLDLAQSLPDTFEIIPSSDVGLPSVETSAPLE